MEKNNRYSNGYYNPNGNYGPEQATAPGYQTYIYKDRRYGYQPSYLDPYLNNAPTRRPEDRYSYDVSMILFYFFIVRGRGIAFRNRTL